MRNAHLLARASIAGVQIFYESANAGRSPVLRAPVARFRYLALGARSLSIDYLFRWGRTATA